jgi:hypothetical protein
MQNFSNPATFKEYSRSDHISATGFGGSAGIVYTKIGTCRQENRKARPAAKEND